MEQGNQDDIDLCVSGYIMFGNDNAGEFQFGAGHGVIDYRIEKHHASEHLAFFWEGEDALHPVSERGWAMLTEG